MLQQARTRRSPRRPAGGGSTTPFPACSSVSLPAPRTLGLARSPKISRGLERRAADQSAIDIRHREQRRGVVRLDAPSVQQRDVRRAALRKPRTQASRAPPAPRPATPCARCRSPTPARRRPRAATRRAPRPRAPRPTGATRRLRSLARSRSSSVSPTHAIGVIPPPAPRAPSPRRSRRCRRKYCRRSEWPTITYRQPNSASIAAETSPVYAPASMLAHVLRAPRDRRARRARPAPAADTGTERTLRARAPAVGCPSGGERREQRRIRREPAVHLPVADDEFAAHARFASCGSDSHAEPCSPGCGGKSLKLYRSAARGATRRFRSRRRRQIAFASVRCLRETRARQAVRHLHSRIASTPRVRPAFAHRDAKPNSTNGLAPP